MGSTFIASCTLIPLLLSTGAIRDRVEIMERDIRELRQEIIKLHGKQATLLSEIGNLAGAFGSNGELADLADQIEEMRRSVQALIVTQNDSEMRLRRMEERIEATMRSFYSRPQRPPAGYPPMGEEGEEFGREEDFLINGGQGAETPEGVATTYPGMGTEPTLPVYTLQDPVELYQTAYADFARGNYELAILGFQEYLDRFPASDFADDAQYWVGEAYYRQEKHADSVRAFEAVIDLFPDGDKVPLAMLKKGYALFEMNRIVEGIRELQTLVRDYRDTNAARLARQRLQGMGLSSP